MKSLRIAFRVVSVLLIVAILFSTVMTVAAEKNAIHLTIRCNNSEYRLNVIQEDEKWFGNIGDLAAISGCESGINNDFIELLKSFS